MCSTMLTKPHGSPLFRISTLLSSPVQNKVFPPTSVYTTVAILQKTPTMCRTAHFLAPTCVRHTTSHRTPSFCCTSHINAPPVTCTLSPRHAETAPRIRSITIPSVTVQLNAFPHMDMHPVAHLSAYQRPAFSRLFRAIPFILQDKPPVANCRPVVHRLISLAYRPDDQKVPRPLFCGISPFLAYAPSVQNIDLQNNVLPPASLQNNVLPHRLPSYLIVLSFVICPTSDQSQIKSLTNRRQAIKYPPPTRRYTAHRLAVVSDHQDVVLLFSLHIRLGYHRISYANILWVDKHAMVNGNHERGNH